MDRNRRHAMDDNAVNGVLQAWCPATYRIFAAPGKRSVNNWDYNGNCCRAGGSADIGTR
jgi:hypothetical protein